MNLVACWRRASRGGEGGKGLLGGEGGWRETGRNLGGTLSARRNPDELYGSEGKT